MPSGNFIIWLSMSCVKASGAQLVQVVLHCAMVDFYQSHAVFHSLEGTHCSTAPMFFSKTGLLSLRLLGLSRSTFGSWVSVMRSMQRTLRQKLNTSSVGDCPPVVSGVQRYTSSHLAKYAAKEPPESFFRLSLIVLTALLGSLFGCG